MPRRISIAKGERERQIKKAQEQLILFSHSHAMITASSSTEFSAKMGYSHIIYLKILYHISGGMYMFFFESLGV